jgi:hypothetical protein
VVAVADAPLAGSSVTVAARSIVVLST